MRSECQYSPTRFGESVTLVPFLVPARVTCRRLRERPLVLGANVGMIAPAWGVVNTPREVVDALRLSLLCWHVASADYLEEPMAVDGTYSVDIDTPMGKQSGKLTLAAEGDSLSGSFSGPMGEQSFSGGRGPSA